MFSKQFYELFLEIFLVLFYTFLSVLVNYDCFIELPLEPKIIFASIDLLSLFNLNHILDKTNHTLSIFADTFCDRYYFQTLSLELSCVDDLQR